MIMVVKEFTFDAAHFLPGYDGKCGRIHGHRWILQIGVKGNINLQTGMVVDFSEIKRIVHSLIIDKLDHRFLNEIDDNAQLSLFPDYKNPSFPKDLPTAENMLMWIVDTLKPMFTMLNLSLVRLYESPTSYVEWRAESK